MGQSWVSSSTQIMGWWLTSTSLMIRELKPISVSVLKTGNNMAKEKKGGGAEGGMALPPTLVEITPLHASGSVGSLEQMVSF